MPDWSKAGNSPPVPYDFKVNRIPETVAAAQEAIAIAGADGAKPSKGTRALVQHLRDMETGKEDGNLKNPLARLYISVIQDAGEEPSQAVIDALDAMLETGAAPFPKLASFMDLLNDSASRSFGAGQKAEQGGHRSGENVTPEDEGRHRDVGGEAIPALARTGLGRAGTWRPIYAAPCSEREAQAAYP